MNLYVTEVPIIVTVRYLLFLWTIVHSNVSLILNNVSWRVKH